MISLDEFVHTQAKAKGYNISEVGEKALRMAVSGSIDEPEEERQCDWCHKKDIELTWICPDEKWICDKCLNTKVKKSMIAVASRRA